MITAAQKEELRNHAHVTGDESYCFSCARRFRRTPFCLGPACSGQVHQGTREAHEEGQRRHHG